MSKKPTWRNYLRYLKSRAKRTALKQARLTTAPEPLRRRHMVDGQGGVQLEYDALTPYPPWRAEDVARYEALANGGDWDAI